MSKRLSRAEKSNFVMLVEKTRAKHVTLGLAINFLFLLSMQLIFCSAELKMNLKALFYCNFRIQGRYAELDQFAQVEHRQPPLMCSAF